ncbi:MAG TPA: SRPBCC family protein [Pyrinomonadaceae bacterium]|jgi:ligand-binding SRPBCC domain-containing protein
MKFVKETIIKAAPERVFAFHELPDAFERLVPPWEDVKVIQKADISEIGSRTIIEQKIFKAFPSRWVAEHTRYEPPRLFEDVQISGPFKAWRHRHIVLPHPAGAVLRDEIVFEPPLKALGRLAMPLVVMPRIKKMFDYRHDVTRRWCEAQSDADKHGKADFRG